jgi:histidine phosphotransferase ChpT
MAEGEGIGDLELAALISSRICHDVISPVGAIANGLEMLDEEQDQAMREQAMGLIRRSAYQASAKLQFARLAFGAAGSAGAQIDLRDAERVARDFVQGPKHSLAWEGPPATLPKNKVKLLLNLVALAVTALPRGGTITAKIEGDAPDVRFSVLAKGEPARLQEHVAHLLTGGNGVSLDAHSIQPYYAGLIAAAAGMRVEVESRENEVELKAT